MLLHGMFRVVVLRLQLLVFLESSYPQPTKVGSVEVGQVDL